MNLNIEDIGIAPIVIVSWSRKLIVNMAKIFGARLSPNWSIISNGFISYSGQLGNNRISFTHIPEGAPATVVAIENMIACGAKKIIGLGWAGGISPKARIGSVIMPTACIREEGTSKHYLCDSIDVKPDDELFAALQKSAKEKDISILSGTIWTTDAIYRELHHKIMMYKKIGTLCVDMETSAMYAIGMFRNVQICNLLVISDELGIQWNPGFSTKDFETGLRHVQDIILNWLKT